MFSKFMETMQPPALRISASKENLFADNRDVKAAERQLQSSPRDLGSAWRCVYGNTSHSVFQEFCFLP